MKINHIILLLFPFFYIQARGTSKDTITRKSVTGNDLFCKRIAEIYLVAV